MANLIKPAGILLPAIRISFALVLLTACLFLIAELLGFTPDESKFLLNSRKQVSEALAIQFSIFAPNQDTKSIQKTLGYVVKRTPEIESAGIRLKNGQLIFQIGDHSNAWGNYDKGKSSSTHLIVPILQSGEPWGDIELKFLPLRGESVSDFYQSSTFKMSGFILLIGFFVYLVFMLRTLKLLDPSAVIPERVNTAFDTLTEGIIVLDDHEQIVLANKSVTEKLSLPLTSLMGVKLSTLQWKTTNSDFSGHPFPWQKVLASGKSYIGTQLKLTSSDNKVFKFVVNASPIQGANAETHGVLITLDDITELEERNTALQTMVLRLEESQAQVQQQNKELNYLATRDSLTGCLNRRAFNEQFDKAFKDAQQNGTELSCFMADIDHFKAVNDNYGHAKGDEVIKLLAELLHANTRKVDLVARYGGEEFCVVLPGFTVDEAATVAERIRLRLKDESTNRFESGPRVTASFGVASLKDNPAGPSELNNFADEALYTAKESGRNRVICWQPKNETVNEVVGQDNVVEENKQHSATTVDDQIETDSLSNLKLRVLQLESIASKFSAELEYTRHYDAVTGLPNQVLFYDRINQVIERGNRYDQLAAVLVIDIGMLSQTNTTLGRTAGDKLLVEMAERLKATFRKYDGISRLTVSHFGGDEFAVLLTELGTKEAVTWIVNRLLESLSEPIDIDGNSVYAMNHVGVSLYPSDANTVDNLINNAMIAKKYSKQMHSETNYQFFDEHMQQLSIKHVNLDKELRRAIQNEEWVLLYQPKMDIKKRSIIGVEALIRWQHPTRGLLSPFEFIDFAEQRGMIVAIGDWVIKKACLQIKEWEKSMLSDCRVAVNLSAVQLRQDDFVSKIFQTLADTGIPPRLLELEVTESTLMNNFDVALASLKRLNSRGIAITIDDFGTGYSSLGYLKNLPINTLKIDRIFIKDICNDNNDKQIVKALISMAHSMGMIVVAEGVEEQNQYDLLAQYACDEIQGYLLSKPISAIELTDVLRRSGSNLIGQ
jgi:diguanylate cyclase (GGDEF)-like protein/PAS domain S-box-containing protein